jgi:methyltransferase-like protein/SAM-dependent methyltransferase
MTSDPANAFSVPGARSTYDEVPYVSFPYVNTHVLRLATIARLFGMTPAAPTACRVLELGCGTGGNLVPMAEQLPDSQFLGIDISTGQIAQAQRWIGELGLPNVRVEVRDLRQIGRDYGQFDYIVAHGVYSWIPPEAQQKLLDICRDNLAPQGVAFVSYNTYPGWGVKRAIRDMMVYRARHFSNPRQRAEQALAMIESIAAVHGSANEAYGIALKAEAQTMRQAPEGYVTHEYLEDHNEPLYFYQFVERARAHDLQYLGESPMYAMSPKSVSAPAQELLRQLASDPMETEQYLDFLRNREFRQTLVCHASIPLDRRPAPQLLREMHVASSIKPDVPLADPATTDRVRFSRNVSFMESGDPLVKLILDHLGQAWPASVSFAELFATAQARLGADPAVVDAAGQMTPRASYLAATLLDCYCTDLLELSVAPWGAVPRVTRYPTARPLARQQARAGQNVTNLWHANVRLNEFQRNLLLRLDGRLDRDGLVEEFARLAASGAMQVMDAGRPTTDPARVRQMLTGSIDESLHQLASAALLIA